MKNYLITPSLLGSFNWYMTCRYGDPKKLREDWLNTLRKIWTGTSEAAQKGIDFEDSVKKCCDDTLKLDIKQTESYWKSVQNVAKVVKGGKWQEKLKKTIAFDNKEFLLYGRADVIKEDIIYDIKTTKTYKAGKFKNNSQHSIYCYCANIYEFKYLVSDFKKTYEESYSLTEDACLNNINSLLGQFVSYLKSDDVARSLYCKHWQSKY